MRNRTYAYIGTRKRCGACALKAQCTSGVFRFLAIHGRTRPATRSGVGEHARVCEGAAKRKKVEALFPDPMTRYCQGRLAGDCPRDPTLFSWSGTILPTGFKWGNCQVGQSLIGRNHSL